MTRHSYATTALTYFDNGWSPLPLPHQAKASPPTGTTGADGKDVTRDDVEGWCTTERGNVALRVPDGVIGIDVDDYDDKHGATTLAQLEAEHGALPPTWSSTSRGPGVSSIRLYRVPPGTKFPGVLGEHIEVIQHHHRYLVAAPSIHPNGQRYRWYKPNGEQASWPPRVDELPELPATWVKGLRLGQRQEPPPPPHLALVDDSDSIAEHIKNTHSWHDLLTADGWTLVKWVGGDTLWRRPGKDHGTSAKLHEPDGPLIVFTTHIGALCQLWATTPARDQDYWSYSLFGYIAATRYNGDRSETARDYRRRLNEANAYTISRSPEVAQALAIHLDEPDPDEPWDDPIPLGESEAVAKFPTEVLPTWVQPIVESIADDMQSDTDLPAVLCIVALAVACAGSRHVVVRGTWKEPLNIYCAVALPPSSGKSPAFKRLMRPLYEYEKRRADESSGQVEHVAQKRRMIEKAMKRAEDKGDELEARIQLDRLLNTPEARPFRLIVDDVTPEALVNKLYEHGQRLALLSTEGGPFDMMAGRYSDNANLDPYLKPWSNDPIAVDRVNRGTQIIERPVLTIGLTVQPTVITKLAENPSMIGKGLTARFMYSVPVSPVGMRDMHYEPVIDPAAEDMYRRGVEGLLQAELDQDNGDITIDRDALDEFNGWRQGIENQRGEGGQLATISEWSTKLESTVIRVAGLFSLADGYENVDLQTMRRAIAVGNYWLSHIRAVLDLWGQDDTVSKARQVLSWASAREVSEFSVRDLYGALRRLFPVADDTRPVLNLLTERGWIRPLFDGPLVLGRRGVDSPRYAVLPFNLWIKGRHARHARHVPKDEIEENSLTLSSSQNDRPCAHDTHDAQDISADEGATDGAAGEATTTSDDPSFDLF